MESLDTQSVIYIPGTPNAENLLKITDPQAPLQNNWVSLYSNKIPRWLLCITHRVQTFLHPFIWKSCHELSVCASAVSPFHDEQIKLFAVFLSLNGNLLLCKFRTVIWLLTFGSIQNTHTLLSSTISLVICRLHVIFSRWATSRCCDHSLYSFIHPLKIFLFVPTMRS